MEGSQNGVILTQKYQAPCGTLLLGAWGDCLCLCEWEVAQARRSYKRISHALGAEYRVGMSLALQAAIRELDDYFAGRCRIFRIPFLAIGTSFQKAVWQALMTVPYGKTATYSDIAMAINCPRSVRAVATAIRDNALSVVIPCHRIVPRQKGIGNYSGGMQAKAWLLEHECAFGQTLL